MKTNSLHISLMSVLIFVFIVSYYLVGYHFAVNFPLNHDDGVHFLLSYGQLKNGSINFLEYLTNPKNGCPHIVDRILNVLSNLILGQTNFIFIILVGNLGLIALLVVAANNFRLNVYEISVVSVLLFTPIGYIYMFPTCSGTYVYVVIFLYLAMRSMHNFFVHSSIISAILCFVFSVFLVFSFCNGFLALFLTILFGASQYFVKGRFSRGSYILLLTLIVLLIWYYFNYVSSGSNIHLAKDSLVDKVIKSLTINIYETISYPFVYLGVLAKYLPITQPIKTQICGVAGLFMYVAASMYWFRERKSGDFNILASWVIINFIFLTGILSFMARMKYTTVLTARYEMFGVLGTVFFLLMMFDFIRKYSSFHRTKYGVLFVSIIFLLIVSYYKYDHSLMVMSKSRKISEKRLSQFIKEGTFVVHPGTGGRGPTKVKDIEEGLKLGCELKFYCVE